jgi:ABC-type uncharacterized transport system ATPase subunit
MDVVVEVRVFNTLKNINKRQMCRVILLNHHLINIVFGLSRLSFGILEIVLTVPVHIYDGLVAAAQHGWRCSFGRVGETLLPQQQQRNTSRQCQL